MGTLPEPGDVVWQVVDLLARVVALREALEDGHLTYAAAIAERVELDLLALQGRLEQLEAA